MGDIVCISHLRWDFVWQRPQHILSRLSGQTRVLFVEEPVCEVNNDLPRLDVFKGQGASNVQVVRLIQPDTVERWIGHGEAISQRNYTELLNDYLQAEGYDEPVLWLYTPMALDFVDEIPHSLLVYDVMDQLAAFKGAPPELLQREEELLKRADLVFTGGPSLFRAKQPFNPKTFHFASGVEAEHFARAANPDSFKMPSDLAGIPHPILGYYGVIDERMDIELLSYLCHNRPDWHIVLLGPLAKIAREDVPDCPNLHLLGMKSYSELPAYLAHFDVALVPFALNEATRYLSPTKTLEYIAAHKPVVATPIQDLIELYGSVVRVAHSPEEFVQEVAGALAEKDRERREGEDTLLEEHSWDNIAQKMEELIAAELEVQSSDRLPETSGDRR